MATCTIRIKCDGGSVVEVSERSMVAAYGGPQAAALAQEAFIKVCRALGVDPLAAPLPPEQGPAAPAEPDPSDAPASEPPVDTAPSAPTPKPTAPKADAVTTTKEK